MTDIIAAIVALDSTAQISVHGEDVVWHDGNPNGITVQQITEKQSELTAIAAASLTAEAENKASAKSKLAALGLSAEEISAAFGI